MTIDSYLPTLLTLLLGRVARQGCRVPPLQRSVLSLGPECRYWFPPVFFYVVGPRNARATLGPLHAWGNSASHRYIPGKLQGYLLLHTSAVLDHCSFSQEGSSRPHITPKASILYFRPFLRWHTPQC